jgi:hypothetical protein
MGDSYEFGMWGKGRLQRSSAVRFNVNQEIQEINGV